MTTGSGSKTIGSIFMNDAAQDEIGIRHTGGSNLWYTNSQSFRWFGTGVLDKPISDFETSVAFRSQGVQPYFISTGDVGIWLYHNVIPEPAEYALVFGLFALAFVIFRRRFQKKGLN